MFCASLADVFDNEVPAAWRSDLFSLICATPSLDWLLLTKRIGNANQMLPGDWGDGWSNVWLGATIANQEEAGRDIPKLLTTPARVRFLSIEPMLGSVDLRRIVLKGAEHPERGQPPVSIDALRGWYGGYGEARARIDWVICGGESGPHARPMNPSWARSLRDQCTATGVSFHFKQWGEFAPEQVPPVRAAYRWPIEQDEPEGGVWSYHIGKKAAGRLLDGRTWDEVP